MMKNNRVVKIKFLALVFTVFTLLTFITFKALAVLISGGLLLFEALGAIIICLIFAVVLWNKSRNLKSGGKLR